MDVDTILSKRLTDREGRECYLSEHAIARSESRFISFAEIKATLGHGTKRAADKGAWEYRFAGVIVVCDPTESIVLTVYPEPGYGIDLDKVVVSEEMKQLHEANCRSLQDKRKWTSHTVAVIDQSGSMRATDIDKNVTRSDLVWLTLAVDLVTDGLDRGERTSTDILSVVFMKDDATVVIDRQPIDWVLFNRIVDIMNSEKPSSNGNYVPALAKAEELLLYNRSPKCALALLFLSDGKPSDHTRPRHQQSMLTPRGVVCMKSQIARRIEEMASLFGKRLNMCFFAIGPPATDFRMLKHMANQAKAYDCPVVYQPATLKAGCLSTALKTMTTTTTATKFAIAEIPKDFEYRKIRKMRKSEVGHPCISNTWDVIRQKDLGEGRKSIVKSEWTKNGWSKVRPVFSDPAAVGIAWEKRWFGEGTERIAKELREVGKNGNKFVGPRMVLKASITVSNSVNVDSKEFHKRFCKSQLKSAVFAERFNQVTSKFPVTVPTLEFLPCWVYMVVLKSGERKGYLVEPSLDVHKYRNFNDNQGNVYSSPTVASVRSSSPGASRNLDTLFETGESDQDSEEEDGDECNEHDSSAAFQGPSALSSPMTTLADEVETSDVLQAFSCWTYKVASGRRYLVCDLQGTFDDDADGRRKYRLTDPVIHTSTNAKKEIQEHYSRANDETQTPRERFGRTDRGQEGINDFFRSHKCSKLCRMLGSRRKRPHALSATGNFTYVLQGDRTHCMPARKKFRVDKS